MLTQKVLDRQESVLEYGPRSGECRSGHEFTILTIQTKLSVPNWVQNPETERAIEIQRCWRCSARKEVWITLEVSDEWA